MANNLPRDPVILLSFINTRLRDEYDSLADLCSALDAEQAAITEALAEIGYTYEPETNQFR